MVWFTVELSDKPGSLARMAAALGDRGINISAIVGIAEDTGGALMLSTSDPEGTRKAFADVGVTFENAQFDALLDRSRYLAGEPTAALSLVETELGDVDAR